jgi:hypothetical protein
MLGTGNSQKVENWGSEACNTFCVTKIYSRIVASIAGFVYLTA